MMKPKDHIVEVVLRQSIGLQVTVVAGKQISALARLEILQIMKDAVPGFEDSRT